MAHLRIRRTIVPPLNRDGAQPYVLKDAELLVKRKCVEPARGGKGALNDSLVDSVAQRVEEADILAWVAHLRGEASAIR